MCCTVLLIVYFSLFKEIEIQYVILIDDVKCRWNKHENIHISEAQQICIELSQNNLNTGCKIWNSTILDQRDDSLIN